MTIEPGTASHRSYSSILYIPKAKSHKRNLADEAKDEGNTVVYHPVEEMRIPHHLVPVEPPEIAGTQSSHELPAPSISRDTKSASAKMVPGEVNGNE